MRYPTRSCDLVACARATAVHMTVGHAVTAASNLRRVIARDELRFVEYITRSCPHYQQSFINCRHQCLRSLRLVTAAQVCAARPTQLLLLRPKGVKANCLAHRQPWLVHWIAGSASAPEAGTGLRGRNRHGVQDGGLRRALTHPTRMSLRMVK